MSEYHSEIALPRSDAAHSPAAVGFLNTVYMWMFLGLAITSLVSWVVAATPALVSLIFGNPWVFYGLLIFELILVVAVNAAIRRISAAVATFLFLLYSAVNGATLASVFLAYELGSVAMAFVSATCLFGTMSLYGYFTKRSLSGWGSYLFVGLLAVIVCTVINVFFRSPLFDFILSIVGIVVFLGLTAYDTQKILRIGEQLPDASGDQAGGYDDSGGVSAEWGRKLAILGALALYLDFINLFLYMLRLFGKRR